MLAQSIVKAEGTSKLRVLGLILRMRIYLIHLLIFNFLIGFLKNATHAIFNDQNYLKAKFKKKQIRKQLSIQKKS
jgi:hypothetical protein